MAQYASDDDREDYSDIGDVHSSLNFASVCDENPSDEAIDAVMVPPVPTKMPVNQDPKPSSKNKHSPKDPMIILKQLSDEMGVPISVSMENQVKALAHAGEEPSKDNLTWYLRGFILCQSSSAMPSIKDATAELRSEVKRIQISSNELNKSGKMLEKAAKGLQDEIQTSAGSTRTIFDEALANISDYVMSTMESLRESTAAKSAPPTVVDTLKTTPISVPTLREDRIVEETHKRKIIVPDAIETPAGVGTSKSETKAKEDDVIASRKALMLSLGYTSVFMKELTPDLIIAAIPPNLLSEIKGQRLTHKVKLALKDIIRANLVEATKDK